MVDEDCTVPAHRATKPFARHPSKIVAELVLNDERIEGMGYEIAYEASKVVTTLWFRDVLNLD
ncbi:hypothetical protein SB748_25025 [Rhizobium sp. SIMBA_035]